MFALGAATVSGCNDRPSAPHTTVQCNDQAPPVFVASRLDDDIADHAWIRDAAGAFHLFFHNEGHGAPTHIEHYVSTDLIHFRYVGVALEPIPNTWDADGLWAPHIIRTGGLYTMFYTGLEGTGADAKQRIGVATSRDLMTWTRLAVNRCYGTSGDGCAYECRECWTAWGAGGSFDDQCRDPFVIYDAAENRWLMFATAKSTNGFGVVTVAASDDLSRWSGVGFVDATRRLAGGTGGQPTGGQCENPFVMAHDGVNYLLFTDWWDAEDPEGTPGARTIVQFATSATLDVDTLGSANWTYRGYTPDPGVNAIEVQEVDHHTIMSQSIAYPSSADYPEHRRELRLKCVTWDSGLAFRTSNVILPRSPDPLFLSTAVRGRTDRAGRR